MINRKNIIVRKRKYLGLGDEMDVSEGIYGRIENPTVQMTSTSTPAGINIGAANDIINQNKEIGFKGNVLKGMDKVSAGMGKANGYIETAKTVVNGFTTGAKNTNKGLYDSTIEEAKGIQQNANDVNKTYQGGENQLNLLKRGPQEKLTAKDLKTHKGWVNILGTTASAAMSGAKVGGVYGAVIGGVAGLVGSSLGEIFGWKKRKKQAREINNARQDANYAVDYYNSKQAEQLTSANENAAHSIANENRRSVLGLMAHGGRMNRKNVLIGKLC